ncbi:MAG: hypothetical protein SF066_03365 [Thermoanaerobaculia bacterium]|nr:hypothetical protein [Thermoanaerobaculia bacterium]
METTAEKEAQDHAVNMDVVAAHPVGTGFGAIGGGAAGAALGAAVAGPAGALLGAVVGGVTGGLVGKGAAELVNPLREGEYWSSHYAERPYVAAGTPYDQYEPAYRYGWEARGAHDGRRFEEVEASLEHGWDTAKGASKLAWSEAKAASRDAWHHVDRVEKPLPGGNAEHDGR